MMTIQWIQSQQRKNGFPMHIQNSAWFTFYHDAFYRAVKWGADGKQLTESIKAGKKGEPIGKGRIQFDTAPFLLFIF